jgi:hypothetical protein
MSCPVSFIDDIKALQICKSIYDIRFDPDENAAARCISFRKDVIQLKTVLEKRRKAIQLAHSYIDVEDTAFRQESNVLIGDFVSTLEQCWKLLQKYVKYKKGASFFNSLVWYATVELKVKSLQKRIQNHTARTSFYTNPILIELSTESNATNQEILNLLRQHLPGARPILLPILCRVQERCRENINNDVPSNWYIPKLADIPRRQGLEALRLYFSRSIIRFTGSEDRQTTEQYLNLLKVY